MKQWYSFYLVDTEARAFISNIEEQININGSKLKQVVAEIQESKLKQADSELSFPQMFAFVPWMHQLGG